MFPTASVSVVIVDLGVFPDATLVENVDMTTLATHPMEELIQHFLEICTEQQRIFWEPGGHSGVDQQLTVA